MPENDLISFKTGIYYEMEVHMSGSIPTPVKLYHIVHIDKLSSIIKDGGLLCDAVIQAREPVGTTIGMSKIKKRRMKDLTLPSYPDLYVGDCVPFYFCPRSVMLYLFFAGDHPELDYRGGQEPIVHLVADLHMTLLWARQNGIRFVFTSSNAGSGYFNDYTSEKDLDKINWNAVRARDWRDCREEKQAEFLVENKFPWNLIERIGVYSVTQYYQLSGILSTADHRPPVEIKRDWYY